MLLQLEDFCRVKDQLEFDAYVEIASALGCSLDQVRQFFELQSASPADVFISSGKHGTYLRIDDPRIFEAALRALGAKQPQSADARILETLF